MELNNIPKSACGAKRRKRLGAGPGTGLGKTCGRGIKGYKSRSGSSIRPGFEGGQMPLYRKLPHRGFNNDNFRTEYDIVNVSDLEALAEAGVTDVSLTTLVEHGVLPRKAKLLKVLGHGEISKKVTVHADKASASASAKIEAAGGSITLAPVKEKPKKKEYVAPAA